MYTAPSSESAVAGAFLDLFRALTHELNQPLASILSNAQAAQHLLESPRIKRAEVRSILLDISSQNKRVSNSLKQLRELLKLSRASAQKSGAGAAVREAIALLRGELMSRRIFIRARLGENLGEVEISGSHVGHVTQALIRAVANAMDSTRRYNPHCVEIRAVALAATLCVSVESPDGGVDAEKLERMQHTFFTGSRDPVAFDIAICRLIVAGHAGGLWLARRSGQVTGFHFTVPILREKET
jgi:C4-dicarboxylate-specific signal transduction histidine kinase